MPDRLRRLEETFARLPIYFVTANTHTHQPILSDADVHNRFVEFAKEGESHGAWIGAYVLMPDHFHLFVAFDDERLELSSWMKSLKNTLSKVFRSKDIPAPHWQKGFFDHVLRSEESYAQKWEYVRDNPVRAELARKWSEWPFAGQIFDLEFRRDTA